MNDKKEESEFKQFLLDVCNVVFLESTVLKHMRPSQTDFDIIVRNKFKLSLLKAIYENNLTDLEEILPHVCISSQKTFYVQCVLYKKCRDIIDGSEQHVNNAIIFYLILKKINPLILPEYLTTLLENLSSFVPTDTVKDNNYLKHKRDMYLVTKNIIDEHSCLPKELNIFIKEHFSLAMYSFKFTLAWPILTQLLIIEEKMFMFAKNILDEINLKLIYGRLELSDVENGSLNSIKDILAPLNKESCAKQEQSYQPQRRRLSSSSNTRAKMGQSHQSKRDWFFSYSDTNDAESSFPYGVEPDLCLIS
ncbi:MAG: hypothetical protein CMF49_08135 [Legionellales bacterium]|nr:hypothetical protein [Legionellales bacterium]|tara:strand:- start:480 stop:1397 length:918 start_codon:yes stop_codon:yes gene_type:complete